MNKQQFKEKYLTNAFFFVSTREQFNKLQDVALEFGLKNPVGGKDKIEYDIHDVSKSIAPKRGVKVAKNLTIFPNGRFQKSDFWIRGASYGEPKDFGEFISDYNSLED